MVVMREGEPISGVLASADGACPRPLPKHLFVGIRKSDRRRIRHQARPTLALLTPALTVLDTAADDLDDDDLNDDLDAPADLAEVIQVLPRVLAALGAWVALWPASSLPTAGNLDVEPTPASEAIAALQTDLDDLDPDDPDEVLDLLTRVVDLVGELGDLLWTMASSDLALILAWRDLLVAARGAARAPDPISSEAEPPRDCRSGAPPGGRRRHRTARRVVLCRHSSRREGGHDVAIPGVAAL